MALHPRHEKPCVLPYSSGTCVYLADGMQVVIRRGPKVKGPVWLEVVPQGHVTAMAAPAAPKQELPRGKRRGRLTQKIIAEELKRSSAGLKDLEQGLRNTFGPFPGTLK